MKKNDEKGIETILKYWNDDKKCDELRKKYNVKTSVEAIGYSIIELKPNQNILIEAFFILQELCEEAILNTIKEINKNENHKKAEVKQSEFHKNNISILNDHKNNLRSAKIWLKMKLREIENGTLSENNILKLNWNRSREQLINGFTQLSKTSYRGKPLFSCNAQDLENFVDSRFIFDGEIPLNAKYKIEWNGEKHDLTILFKEMHEHKLINNTKDEIAHFMLEIFPIYSFSSVKKYLDGSIKKTKYNLQISLFK